MACTTVIVVCGDINQKVEKFLQVLILLSVRSLLKSFITNKIRDSESDIIWLIAELAVDLIIIEGKISKEGNEEK